MHSWDATRGGRVISFFLSFSLSFYLSLSLLARINLDSGSWIALDGDGGGLADHGSLSSAASSSSFQTVTNQELSLLMPCGSVSWWGRRDWEHHHEWLQRNVIETTREFDAKLDVTPETNDTSTSEVASTLLTFVWLHDIRVNYSSECVYALSVLGVFTIAFIIASDFCSNSSPCTFREFNIIFSLEIYCFCIIKEIIGYVREKKLAISETWTN